MKDGPSRRFSWVAYLQVMDKRMVSFLLLAYGFTWTVVGGAYAMGIHTASDPWYPVVGGICMLGPGLAAMVQQRLLDRAPWSGLALQVRGTRWKTLFWTVALGLLLVPGTMLVIHLFGNVLGWPSFGRVSVTDARVAFAVQELLDARGMELTGNELGPLGGLPAWAVLLAVQGAALLGAVTLNVPFMLGEELGWRGYLWQRIAHWRGLERVLFTGVVWGLWHAPLIVMGHNYPGHPFAGVGMMVVLCLLFGLLFDWTRARSGSIWSSVLLHGLINGSAGGFALFAWGGHTLVGSPVGLAGFLAFAGFCCAILAVDGPYRRSFLRKQELQPLPIAP